MGILGSLGKILTKSLGDDFLGSIGEKVEEGIEQVRLRVQMIVSLVVKSLILVFMILLGGIFVLVGLGIYLESAIVSLAPGLGFIIVGAVLLILGIIVKLLK